MVGGRSGGFLYGLPSSTFSAHRGNLQVEFKRYAAITIETRNELEQRQLVDIAEVTRYEPLGCHEISHEDPRLIREISRIVDFLELTYLE